MEGVEPTCLAAPDPKSGASASFATSAQNQTGLRGGIIKNSIKLFEFLPRRFAIKGGKNNIKIARLQSDCWPGLMVSKS